MDQQLRRLQRQSDLTHAPARNTVGARRGPPRTPPSQGQGCAAASPTFRGRSGRASGLSELHAPLSGGADARPRRRLADRAVLDVEEQHCSYWPEFAQTGKERVTVRQLLSHQAGPPEAQPRLAWDELLDRRRAVLVGDGPSLSPPSPPPSAILTPRRGWSGCASPSGCRRCGRWPGR
ncbi:serine hydrolase [Streptomyces sp. NPDC001661]